MDLTRLYEAIGKLSVFIDHLHPIRIVIVVVAIGVGATLAADQVSELYVMTTSTNDSPVWYGWLLAASAVAGCSIWYAARNAYRFQSMLRPSLSAPEGEGIRALLPRFLGLSVPLILALGSIIAFWRVGDQISSTRTWMFVGSLMGLALEALALRYLFRYRRHFLLAMARRLGLAWAPVPDPRLEPQILRIGDLDRATKIAYAISMTLNIAAAVALAFRGVLRRCLLPESQCGVSHSRGGPERLSDHYDDAGARSHVSAPWAQ